MIPPIHRMNPEDRIMNYYKNEESENGRVFGKSKMETINRVIDNNCNTYVNNNNNNYCTNCNICINNQNYETSIDSSSSSSNSLSMCPYPGCRETVKYAEPGHEVCCNPLHHILVMCKRFCMVHPDYDAGLKRFYGVMDMHTTLHCVVDVCLQAPKYKGKWCNHDHYLLWLKNFARSLTPDQRCKLQGCPKHVFVEVKSDGVTLRVHDYCSWTHCQEHYMALGTSLDTKADDESGPCVDLTIGAAIEALKAYAQNKSNQPKGVLVDEDFFSKHPKDVLHKPGHQSCWIIVKCKWKGGVRALKTRDGYHWKQNGKRSQQSVEGNTAMRRSLSYDELKRNAGGSMESSKFHMEEYELINPKIEDYRLVKLKKAKVSTSRGREESMPTRRCKPRLCRTDSNLTPGLSSDLANADATELPEHTWVDDFFCY